MSSPQPSPGLQWATFAVAMLGLVCTGGTLALGVWKAGNVEAQAVAIAGQVAAVDAKIADVTIDLGKVNLAASEISLAETVRPTVQLSADIGSSPVGDGRLLRRIDVQACIHNASRATIEMERVDVKVVWHPIESSWANIVYAQLENPADSSAPVETTRRDYDPGVYAVDPNAAKGVTVHSASYGPMEHSSILAHQSVAFPLTFLVYQGPKPGYLSVHLEVKQKGAEPGLGSKFVQLVGSGVLADRLFITQRTSYSTSETIVKRPALSEPPQIQLVPLKE